MVASLEAQIEEIRALIAGLEAQRALLGDAVDMTVLTILRENLAALETQRSVDAPPNPAEEHCPIFLLFSDVVSWSPVAEL